MSEDINELINLEDIAKKMERCINQPKEVMHSVPLPPKVLIHDTSKFPDTPIKPNLLVNKVSEILGSFEPKITIPDKTPIMVKELCKSFNKCINLNANNKSITLILSPKTGSAKSVSSKMYIAQLQSQASIVVVYTVADAIQTCEDINKWSGDKNYARCTYKINDENKDNPLRVNLNQLSQYRCIVISHAMFKHANDRVGIKKISTYSSTKRQFVLIDERIDLYRETQFSLSNLKYLLKLFNDIQQSIDLPSLIENEIKYLKSIQDSFDELKTSSELKLEIIKGKPSPKLEPKKAIFLDKEIRAKYNLHSYDFNNLYNYFSTKRIDLQKIIDPLFLLGDKLDINEVNANIKKHLDSLSSIMKQDFHFFIYTSEVNGSMIMTTENILNEFGSSIVLDATATVNELYMDKVLENQSTVKHIKTTNPRKYTNLTIHKCKGVAQGRTNIYKALTPKELQTSTNLYLDIANSIMTTRNDKLLIIAHKTFKEHLENKNKKKSIMFTHWGDHRGKNNWNTCNKVLVIGWNYLPSYIHYRNYINSVNGIEDINNDLYKDIKLRYETTQIADDLVQAVNRASVRNTVTTDGDCEKSDVYIFYPTNEIGKHVMRMFEDEFNESRTVDWQPSGIEKIQSLAKSYKRMEQVAEYIKKKLSTAPTIRLKVVESYFDDDTNPERLQSKESKISKSSVNRIVNHEEFNLLIASEGIHKIAENKKSFIFEKIHKLSY